MDYHQLFNRLARYTTVEKNRIKHILDYLTFGGKDIIEPDIMTQPIIDLKDGSYALAPFVFINSSVERNLCVLLNQIDEDKSIYSKLSKEKESLQIQNIEKQLNSKGYRFIKAKKLGTASDLDISIIDDKQHCCLCLELKWFIGPSEIREIHNRSEELKKGVRQAHKIHDYFKDNQNRLDSILNIDSNYTFLVAVGSDNWTGYDDIQDKDIPIINVHHLLEKIVKTSLKKTILWLKNKAYLPKTDDFQIEYINFKIGLWESKWHAFKINSPNDY